MILPWRERPVGGLMVSTSLTDDETQALREMAAGCKVLEVGSAFGYSTIVMAQVASYVTAVDPHVDMPGTATAILSNLKAAGVSERVRVVRTRSQDALAELASVGAKFGLVFIDGDHRPDAVRSDLSWATGLVTPHGHIACHDYGEDTCPGVKQVLDQLYPDGPDRLVNSLWVRGG